ncbi:sulfatase [Puteibacter caeruleilacunae]|nr:sulfatase [Puteibacter caeruleilacunae]
MKIKPLTCLLLLSSVSVVANEPVKKQPNVFIAISDDQSFAHTSFNGCTFINTPAFDKVAQEGICFTNCIAGSPGCAPSRSTLVTGRFHWQNEQAGQHASHWPAKYASIVDEFAANGYDTGRTGKGVGPFKYGAPYREFDAAGKSNDVILYGKNSKDERTASGISNKNYYENFKSFINNRDQQKPFFFWFGGHEPHRVFEEGSWKRMGKKLKDVVVPDFLPNTNIIKGDLLDYAVEIEWFDTHLQKMLELMEAEGELDNTIVIITADNGMAFPRAKANCFEYGVHVPLAIRYPKEYPGNRKVDDVVSFADIAPTIFEACNIKPQKMLPMSGESIAHILASKKEGRIDKKRDYVFSGRERHSCSRYKNLGYPQRAIRSEQYLLIWNQRPERWPAGAPMRLTKKGGEECHPLYGVDEKGKHTSEWAFTDVDAAPSKSFLVEQKGKYPELFEKSYGKRGEFELYDIKRDPYCLNNLIDVTEYSVVLKRMKQALMSQLKKTKDPRVVGPDKELFDSYPRYSKMRYFPKPDWMN